MAPRRLRYPRTVFFVADPDAALAFYTGSLGFTEAWRHEEGGATFVAQADREGLELIVQRDERRAGCGRVFLSMDRGAASDVAAEWRARGVDVASRSWGMPVLVVTDPDGNELFLSGDEL